MANPFDLRGPDFLVFYTVLGAAVIVSIAILRRHSESAARTTVPLTDYLKIAYLRGGADEALRVAAVALVDRGLIEVVDTHNLRATAAAIPAGLQRTEERLLESCKESTRASRIIDDESLKVTARAECEGALVRAGLLPDDQAKAARGRLLFMGGLVLGLFAFGKLAVALSRGRTNVFFLIVLAALLGYVLYRVSNPFRTTAGEAMLADLRQLFSALKDRTRSTSVPTGTGELALLAAVFGIGALPVGLLYIPESVFRKPDSRSSSCGSACGSSGSSCGSGCGGSCGGGCGGCGS
jgi:uncharacterized protein (TIGR04222 family)